MNSWKKIRNSVLSVFKNESTRKFVSINDISTVRYEERGNNQTLLPVENKINKLSIKQTKQQVNIHCDMCDDVVLSEKCFNFLNSKYCEKCIKIVRSQRAKLLSEQRNKRRKEELLKKIEVEKKLNNKIIENKTRHCENLKRKQEEKDKEESKLFRAACRKQESVSADSYKCYVEFDVPIYCSYCQYKIGRDDLSDLWAENRKIMPNINDGFDSYKNKISVTIYHNLFNKSKNIKGLIRDVEKMSTTILDKWEKLYKNKEKIRNESLEKLNKTELAIEKTSGIEKQMQKIKSILVDSLLISGYFKPQIYADCFVDNIENLQDYFENLLQHSEYPLLFKREITTHYINNNNILVVNYLLPTIDSIPVVRRVQYIKSSDKFEETYISQKSHKEIYDETLYQVTLRSISEIYKNDYNQAVVSIVFNGLVDTVDAATGKDVRICILSLQTNREKFCDINLAKVHPRTCFKSLKGVGSSRLYGMTPIAPILDIDRNDKRFVAHYDVAQDIGETSNLAAMDWLDFEQLIREIFEMEFSSNGGEVKVTQSSRDGGVDAIAFDPDPLRGGKIIIQAKRYTNIVGISAVRDLYGTVINEGATRGILVTTSDYGADSYSFAKGKPLTLLNGNNLLHILEKHGYKAKIDLSEAKRFFAERQ